MCLSSPRRAFDLPAPTCVHTPSRDHSEEQDYAIYAPRVPTFVLSHRLGDVQRFLTVTSILPH